MEGETLVAGINEERLNKTILNIYNIAEKMQTKFNEVELLMADTSEFFAAPGASQLRDKFDSFKTNFATVVDNVRCYGDDLTKVKTNFHNMSLNAADKIKKEGKV